MDDLDTWIAARLQAVKPSADAFDRTLKRSRLRARNRRLTSAAVGLAFTSALLVAAYVVGRGSPGQLPASEPTPPQNAVFESPVAFSDGRIVRLVDGHWRTVATLNSREAPVPPVVTRGGAVVVLTGTQATQCELWVVSPEGDVTMVASSVTMGFAVQGDRLAYATAQESADNSHYSSTIHVTRVSGDGDTVYSSAIPMYVEVGGFVRGGVLTSSGDGADTAVAVWEPTTDRFSRFPDYGRVDAVDPSTSHAVARLGDGPTPILIRVDVEGSGVEVSERTIDSSSVDRLDGVDILDGDAVAGSQPTRFGADVVVIDETSGRVITRLRVPGGGQVVWLDGEELLVLDKTSPTPAVYRCNLDLRDCAATSSPDFAGAGPYGYGAWLARLGS